MRRAAAMGVALGLVLVGAVAGVVAIGAPAGADVGSPAQQTPTTTAPPGPGCVRIVRMKYVMPSEIRAPDTPQNHDGRRISNDPAYMVDYCDPEGDGTWRLSADPLRDRADACIHLYYDPDQHAGANAPAEVTPLTEIDRVGTLDPWGGLVGTENREQYCRNGDRWVKGGGNSADDVPEGSWRDWKTGECLTIVPWTPDTPRRTTQHPQHLGQVLDDNPFDNNGVRIAYIDVRTLKTYCPKDNAWFRVDNYPVEEIVGNDDYRLNDPGQGTCLVVITPGGGGLPETIVPPGHPANHGTFVSRRDFETHPEYEDDELPTNQMYCFVNGVWQRGDTLARGCSEDNPNIVANESVLPDRCWGTFPTDNYDIGYDGGAWDNISSKLYGWWTDFFFGLGKGSTNVALWATEWAYAFDITQYSQLGLDVGHDFQVNLTENTAFRLEELVFMLLVGWMAITALRGKFTLAGGELVTSMLLMTLVGVLIADRGNYMRSVWDVMDRSSRDLLVAAQGKNPVTYEGDEDDVIADTQAVLHLVLVEGPYDILNWGHGLEGNCADVRNEIVALGPHGASDGPRDTMRARGCRREADFNAVPNGTRLLGSVFTMIVAGMVAFLLLSVALTVVLAKFLVLVLFSLLPFVALAVVLPARGRRLAWLWASLLLQAVVAAIGTTLVLTLLIAGLRRLMEVTENVGIIERFAVMVLFVLLARSARKWLLSTNQASVGRLADNMTNSFRLGGGGEPWRGPIGTQGADLLKSERAFGRGAAGAAQWGAAIGTAAVLSGADSFTEAVGRRTNARLSLRNLREMESGKSRRPNDRVVPQYPRGLTRWLDRRGLSRDRYRGGGGGGGGGAIGGAGQVPPPRPPGGGGGGGGAAVPPSRGPAGTTGPARTSDGRFAPSPMPTARDRAIEALNRETPVRAQRYVNHREQRFWQGVHRAEQRYANDVRMGLDGRFARESYVANVTHHTNRYERMTGQTAPVVGTPWAGPGTIDELAGRLPAHPYVGRPGRDTGVRPEPRGVYERTADAAHRVGDRMADAGRRMEERWAERANQPGPISRPGNRPNGDA